MEGSEENSGACSQRINTVVPSKHVLEELNAMSKSKGDWQHSYSRGGCKTKEKSG